MVSRVCICCGQPIPAQGAAAPPNPNLCAPCASLDERADHSETQPDEQSVPLPQSEADAQLRPAA